MDPEAQDALLDAVTLVRCVLDDDGAALCVVARHAGQPALTAMVLAQWLAGVMQVNGVGRDALDDWQAGAGLR